MLSVLPVFLVLGSIAQSDDLAVAGESLSRSWGLISRRGLSEACSFNLTVEAIDPALGDGYFPSNPPPNRFGEPGDVRPLARWIDSAMTRGEKYRFTSELFPVGPLAPKRTVTSKYFDGRDSWVYQPSDQQATKYRGPTSVARQGLGYYRDMIGYPFGSTSGTRSTPGDSGEPYRLDLLIPSGRYASVGSEVVDGVSCEVIERPGLDKLWLVPGFGWALARREWRWSAGGPIKRRITNRDFRGVAPGFWLPFAASMEVFGTPATRPNRRVGVLKAVAQVAEVDVPDERFSPDFPPGTTIMDRETGGNSRVGPDSGPNAKAAYSIAPTFRPIPWWRRAWVPWAIVSTLVVIGATWTIRRRSVG